MAGKREGYTARSFPLSRRIIIDTGRIGSRKHIIYGLIEADVTVARQLIRQQQAQTGEKLSFTVFIVNCLAHAIDANRYMHAYRNL